MSKPDTPARRAAVTVLRYGLAGLSVAAAVIVTLLLRPDALVAPVFFLAIILSAWFGGIHSGLLAALLAMLAIDYFFLEPRYALSFGLAELPHFFIFFLSAALVSSWSVARKRAETLLQRALDEQEAKVEERTADLRQANEKLQAEIAERRRVEETLRERANLLDLTHDTVSVRDLSDVITYWNRGAEELYGWASGEAIGQVSHRLTQTIFPAPLEQINEQLLGAGRWGGELVHTKRDGTRVVVASRWALQRDEHGTPVAILETNNDITERRRAEEALRESEEQWKAVFENNPTMYFMVDAAGTILSVNPFGAEQLGYTVAELVGHPVLHVFYEADREAVQRNVAVCFEQLGRTMSWEFRKVRKDGTVLWVRETAKAVQIKGRTVVLIVCEDITARKRAEEELKRAEQRLSTVIANTPIVLFALDRSGVFMLSEGRGLDALGLKSGQVVGQSVFDGYRDMPQVLSAVRRALAGEPLTEVVEVNDLVLETHFTPFLDEQGEVAGVNGVAINITERKRAEAELRKQASLLDLTHDTIFVRDLSDVITYWNRGAEELYGWTRGEAVGKVSHQLMQTVFPTPLEEITAELLRTGRWERELIHTRRDGTQVVVASRWALQRDEAGNPVAVLETNNDITERKRAEEELRRSEAYLAEGERLSHTGSWAWNVATRELVHWSQEHYRMYGLDPKMGIPSWEAAHQYIHPEDRARCLETIERAIRKRVECELDFRAVLPGGSIKYIHSVGHPLFNASGDLVEFVGTEMDVTERRRAEEELRKSERQFRALFDQAAVGIAIVTTAGQALESNRKFQQMLGYSAEEFRSLPFAQVTHPDDLKRDQTLFTELISGQRDHYQIEKRYYRKDGSMVWGNLTVSLVRDDKDQSLFGIAIVEDITERKRAEEQLLQVTQELVERNTELWRLQGELRSVESLAALGRVTGTIAHELGTPLNSVLGYSQLLAQEPLSDDARESLAIIEAQAQRMIEIIQHYLAQTRGAFQRRQQLNFNDLVRETLVLLKPIFHTHLVEVTTGLAEALPVLSGDGASLQRVLINVLTNAVDAVEGGGTVSVETRRSTLPESARPGVVVDIRDTGAGIPPELLPRIFELFVTTKASGKGTGLGLALSQEIVKAHGGSIEVSSQVGEGTCVRIFLPTEGGHTPHLVRAPTSEESAGG